MDRKPTRASPFADLDAKRIAGNSLAVAIHVLAFVILLIPSEWEPPTRPARMEVVPIWEVVKPIEIKTPEPPPPKPEPTSRPPQPIARETPIRTPLPDTGPVFDAGDIEAVAGDVGPVVESFEPGPPALATLAYDVHPAPRYPRAALRAGMTGTVTLLVLVDEQGRPREVEVETSSGHRELDRAARAQVLNAWRFHPAQRQGQAVSAYALVPIEFTLP
jgi:protein TonB